MADNRSDVIALLEGAAKGIQGRVLDWTSLEGLEPPPRIWKIEHWLSANPTVIAGPGGVGKTLLVQTVATALAIGRSYIGAVGEQQRVVMIACEDDHDELWRRQISINRFFGIGMADLEGWLHLEARAGLDNLLYAPVYGSMQWTPFYGRLKELIGDFGAGVCFLDNVSQMFGGNENDRGQVTQYCNGTIGLGGAGFCPAHLAHPSKMAGSEFSGSTAWENAVRMRWLLSSKHPEDPEMEVGEDRRFLSRRKANYSGKAVMELNYIDGVFHPSDELITDDGVDPVLQGRRAERLVLEAVRAFQKQEMPSSDSLNSAVYLPRLIKSAGMSESVSMKDLTNAMQRLVLDNRIELGTVGLRPNRHKKYGFVIKE